MTVKQYELYKKRINELQLITTEIHKLNLPNGWTEIFTHLCLYRGWVTLNNIQKSQLLNISTVNSNAVKYLAQKGKKVGLNILEDLSVKIKNEKVRLKAVQLIIEKGVKQSKNELDLIISKATSTLSLFDNIE